MCVRGPALLLFSPPQQDFVIVVQRRTKRAAHGVTRDLIADAPVKSEAPEQTGRPAGLAGLTWVKCGRGSGEAGSPASSAARTGRSDCGSTVGRSSLQQDTEGPIIRRMSANSA